MTTNKALEFAEKFVRYTIIALFGGIIFFLFVSSFFTTCSIPEINEVVLYGRDFFVKHIIAILAILFFGVIAKKKKLSRYINDKFVFAVACCVVGIYAAFICSTQLELISDQKNCFVSATQFLDGIYIAWKPERYAGRYPNQNGLILFFAFIQTLFGKGNALVLQFINLVSAVISVVFMSRISELAFGCEKKRNTALILLMYAPMMLYVTFTYGTMIGLCLSVIGIYYQMSFLKSGKWYGAVISAVCIPSAVMFKSNYLIVLVASVLVYLFYALYKKKIRNAIVVVLLICVYVLASVGVNTAIEKKTGMEISKGVPTVAWITMGMSESKRGPGWYSGYNEQLYFDAGYDSEKAHMQGVEDLKDRIDFLKSDLKYTSDFFVKKVLSMWSEPSFQSLWIQFVKPHQTEFPKWITDLFEVDSTVNRWYCQIYDIWQTATYFFVLVYLALNTKKIKIYQLLPGIIMLGGFLFHLFWEAKGQYSVIYFFLIMPYAISGFLNLTDLLCNIFSRSQKEKAVDMKAEN